MMMGKQLTGMMAVLLLAAGCSAGDAHDGSPGETSASLNERLQALSAPFAEGATGEQVRTLHEYLFQFGYFPSDELRQEHPEWTPVVAQTPRDLGTYDASTTEAVARLQANFGLQVTGAVDQPTLAALKMARCGEPEHGHQLDGTQKYALGGSKWNKSALTWKITTSVPSPLTPATADSAASSAFASWAAVTALTFNPAPAGTTADIEIAFTSALSIPGALAEAMLPAGGGDIKVNTAFTWSTTPTGTQFDLQAVLVHEIGHTLGLSHSTVTGGVMVSGLSPGAAGIAQRPLGLDDKVGVSLLYDGWQNIAGCAKDIGVGINGTVWAIGCDPSADGPLYRFNGTSFIADSTGQTGARLDVGPDGIPWIVRSNGEIRKKSADSTSSGSWSVVGVSPCAKDIGVGGTTTSGSGTAWAIGCSATADGVLHRWSGTQWVADFTNGAAAVVSVDTNGIPWAVHSSGGIFRRSSNSVTSGSWAGLPGVARDIGVAEGNYAWGIGTTATAGSFEIYTFNEQAAGAGSPPAPALSQWNLSTGAASVIDVGPDGRPWAVAQNGTIWRQTP